MLHTSGPLTVPIGHSYDGTFAPWQMFVFCILVLVSQGHGVFPSSHCALFRIRFPLGKDSSRNLCASCLQKIGAPRAGTSGARVCYEPKTRRRKKGKDLTILPRDGS